MLLDCERHKAQCKLSLKSLKVTKHQRHSKTSFVWDQIYFLVCLKSKQMINPRALHWCWWFTRGFTKALLRWFPKSEACQVPFSMFSGTLLTCQNKVCNPMKTAHLTPFCVVCSGFSVESKWSGNAVDIPLVAETRWDLLSQSLDITGLLNTALRCREDGVLADFDRGVVERTGNQPKELLNWTILAMKPRTTKDNN